MQIFIRYKNILKVTILYIIFLFILGGSVKISAQSIKVISPNGGENWKANSTQLIKWKSKSIDKVKIEYSLDKGLSWGVIVQSIDAALGEYSGANVLRKKHYFQNLEAMLSQFEKRQGKVMKCCKSYLSATA